MTDPLTTANALTPERARELFMPWVSMLFVMPHEREVIITAWERDRVARQRQGAV